MRFFLIAVACVALIIVFSYDRLGDLTKVFSSRINGSENKEMEVKADGVEKNGTGALFENDIATGTEEQLDRSIRSVEEEIRRTEEFLQKKSGESAR